MNEDILTSILGIEELRSTEHALYRSSICVIGVGCGVHMTFGPALRGHDHLRVLQLQLHQPWGLHLIRQNAFELRVPKMSCGSIVSTLGWSCRQLWIPCARVMYERHTGMWIC